ncbi:hypothetical protein FGIG_01124 [Fasciola gigantica]|uniref:BHLH domain-containing protein n=1 Tax=Fasciola gigantica TaxID=46835 RepID=A0A504Y5B1_FASGI|nr:hypothetical protein FGIG_01124 [Fasciola gigantica]
MAGQQFAFELPIPLDLLQSRKMSQTPSSMPNKPSDNNLNGPPAAKKSKRGRRSTVPPEQREHVRRLKKQNMERRRRACIADKMNALHTLAMNLIGEDPTQYQKAEKADLLNMCYNVFEHLVTVVNEEPDIRIRVQRIMEQSKDRVTSQYNVSPSSSNPLPSFPTHKQNNIRSNEDKENQPNLLSISVCPAISLSDHHFSTGSQQYTPLQRPPFVSHELYANRANECPFELTTQGLPWNSNSNLLTSPRTTIPAQLSSVDSGIEQSDQSTQPYSVWNLTSDFTKSDSSSIRNPLSSSPIISVVHKNCRAQKPTEILNRRAKGSPTGHDAAPAHSTPLWRPYLE